MKKNAQNPPDSAKIRVLLIDDDESEYHLVSNLLAETKSNFELKWVDSLEKGIVSLAGRVDVVLLDLFLGDSQGLDTFRRIKLQAKDVPVVILSGLDDEVVAVEAIHEGAQDFLVKSHVDSHRMSRVLNYAIKRHILAKDPQNIGLIDPLTGLYNRQGFLVMAEQRLKEAQRNKEDFFVCFAILNDLNSVVETYGKAEGDHAVLTASEILRESFRASDLVARMGTDEFAILTTEQGNHSPKVISARIKANQKYYNAQFNRYRLVLSMCAVRFDPSENLLIQQLADKAGQVFSEYKSNKNIDNFFVAT